MTMLSWTEDGEERTARWRAENGAPEPVRIIVIDDDISAAKALRLARSGTGLLWRGDFHNARQLLRAMDRRIQQRTPQNAGSADVFRANRRARSTRAALLGKILISLEHNHTIQLRRAPDMRKACRHAYGESSSEKNHVFGAATLVPLIELLGVTSAYEWHRKGIDIAALGARIHPAYGVFAPTRNEYIDLLADTPWPQGGRPLVAFDIGTGTGVLAAVLARRGARTVVATDISPRAVQCARDNMRRLGLAKRVRVTEADLWPTAGGRADLIVCNPPWIPARPTSELERGIYDPESDMLNRFIDGLPSYLTPRGEAWLILSDLAEHLGLRTRDEFLRRIADAGLEVIGTHQAAPRHPRAADNTDPLHAARAGERTTLWKLAARIPHEPRGLIHRE